MTRLHWQHNPNHIIFWLSFLLIAATQGRRSYIFPWTLQLYHDWRWCCGDRGHIYTSSTYRFPYGDSGNNLEKVWKRHLLLCYLSLLGEQNKIIDFIIHTFFRVNVDVPICTSFIPISPVAFSSTATLYVEGVFFTKGQGELKRPMQIKYVVHNRSNHTHSLWVSLDSTECFMNAGPKKVLCCLIFYFFANLSLVFLSF